MVRKRTRKYDSDDNDTDSEVEFDFQEEQPRSGPKKYSLRERKKASLLTSAEYYYGVEEEDADGKKDTSDDDFEVDEPVEPVTSYFEPEDVSPDTADGLIDFEDIIRADIVVNKNKIDYDNLIQKTEIKLTQPKKRGRKPKNQLDLSNEEVNQSNPEDTFVENSAVKFENDEKIDEVQLDPTLMIPEVSLSEGKDLLPNGDVKNEPSILNEEDSVKNDEENKIFEPSTTKEVPETNTEDDDDDVIVIPPPKSDVIVLDD